MSNNQPPDDHFKVPSLPATISDKRVPPLNYQPPTNSCNPFQIFVLDEIKEGYLIATHHLPTTKSYVVFGRLPLCDFSMDHPSISRYHAVLQFTTDHPLPSIMDLGSSHRTFINKIELKEPKVLKKGDQIRFGASSRVWVFGDLNEEKEEDDLNNEDPAKHPEGTNVVDNGEEEDDDFYDQTKPNPDQSRYQTGSGQIETAETLKEKLLQVNNDISDTKQKLDQLLKQPDVANNKQDNVDDELDIFMSELKQSELFKSKLQLQEELEQLDRARERLQILVEIAQPNDQEEEKRKPQKRATALGAVVIQEKRQKTAIITPRKQEDFSKYAAKFSSEEGEDEREVDWQPPTDQSGDGKTSLNDKYRY